MTQEPNPYECCGQVRDSNFCPMCGRAVHASEAGRAITQTDDRHVTFGLLSELDAYHGSAVSLHWMVDGSVAWLVLKKFNTENETSYDERAVCIELAADGQLVLGVFRRRDGRQEVLFDRADRIAEHQLWPVEPAAPPPPKDKAT